MNFCSSFPYKYSSLVTVFLAVCLVAFLPSSVLSVLPSVLLSPLLKCIPAIRVYCLYTSFLGLKSAWDSLACLLALLHFISLLFCFLRSNHFQSARLYLAWSKLQWLTLFARFLAFLVESILTIHLFALLLPYLLALLLFQFWFLASLDSTTLTISFFALLLACILDFDLVHPCLLDSKHCCHLLFSYLPLFWLSPLRFLFALSSCLCKHSWSWFAWLLPLYFPKFFFTHGCFLAFVVARFLKFVCYYSIVAPYFLACVSRPYILIHYVQATLQFPSSRCRFFDSMHFCYFLPLLFA